MPIEKLKFPVAWSVLARWERDVRNRKRFTRVSTFRRMVKELGEPFGVTCAVFYGLVAMSQPPGLSGGAVPFSTMLGAAKWLIYSFHNFEARLAEVNFKAVELAKRPQGAVDQKDDTAATVLAKLDSIIDHLAEIEKLLHGGR